MTLQGTIVESPLHRFATHAWKTIAGIGAISIVVGLATLAWPGATTRIIGVLFGLYLLGRGLLGLGVALITPMPGLVRVGALLTAGLTAVFGVLCFLSGFHSTTLLGLWVGIGWVMQAVTSLAQGMSTRGPGRGWLLVSGAIGLLAGFTLIVAPISSVTTLVWTAGLFLVAIGVVEVVRAMQLRRRARSL